jgi:hypothetical protein
MTQWLRTESDNGFDATILLGCPGKGTYFRLQAFHGSLFGTGLCRSGENTRQDLCRYSLRTSYFARLGDGTTERSMA